MRLIVGTIIVFVCVFGGYAAMGGKLLVLWQPFEFVIILGAAMGAFIIGNPAQYIELETEFGVSRIATVEFAGGPAPSSAIGSLVFTRLR